MKFKGALGVDVGEDEQFHVFYKRSFCGRLKKGEKANEVNIKKLIIDKNGFYVCEVNSSFDWAVDLELRGLDFKYEKRSFEDGVQSRQGEVNELIFKLAEMKSRLNDAYTDGQASMYKTKQAEIDTLNALSEMSEQKIDDLVLQNIELQKNFDNALKN